jgi:acetyl-CoA acetyltransferase
MTDTSRLREVFVAGIGMTDFRVHAELESYDLGSEAVLDSLSDAEMEWKDVESAYCGSVYQGTASGHQAIKEVAQSGIPIVNVENACSSGSSAFRLAYLLVGAGIHDVVLVLGMEKMPRGPIPSTAFRPWELTSGFNLQVANYALATVEYMNQTGVSEEDLARVTVKNRRHGILNPKARFQKEVTIDEVMNSRPVALPLRLFHCCPLADGAAAAVLCCKEKLNNRDRAVTVAASSLTSGVYGEGLTAGAVGSLKFPHKEGITELSARQAFEAAGLGRADVDVVQAYDTTVPSELWGLEKLGFCRKGDAARQLKEGRFDLGGALPVNTDGGLMSRGHPLGATGLAQIVELVTQLRGEAGVRQVKGAQVGLAHAMGAGPNSSVTILKR